MPVACEARALRHSALRQRLAYALSRGSYVALLAREIAAAAAVAASPALRDETEGVGRAGFELRAALACALAALRLEQSLRHAPAWRPGWGSLRAALVAAEMAAVGALAARANEGALARCAVLELLCLHERVVLRMLDSVPSVG